jgi:uncharacterized damage-inducible protein DinB
MKEILAGLADYNLKANERLVEILKTAPDSALTKDMGSYYKSVAGTLDHLFIAEVSWLKRFNGFFTYGSLAGSWLISTGMDEIQSRTKGNPRQLFALLHDADSLMAAFVKELDEGDLGTRVRFKTMKGEEMQRKYWNTVLHVLNHGTHHRGEISAMLDMQGIANDYSGFNQYTT